MREQEIFYRLEARYPNAKPALNYENAFQLLVATILSAQCTDVRVNQVTASLFVHYPDARALAAADLEELSREIHSCGCYRVKAKNLIGTAKMLCRDYAGEVPPLMEALTRRLMLCSQTRLIFRAWRWIRMYSAFRTGWGFRMRRTRRARKASFAR